MPSFESAHQPYQQSEYGSRYNQFTYFPNQDHQGHYPLYSNGGSHGTGHLLTQPYDHFKLALPSASVYDQTNQYGSASMTLPPPIGAPMLPPLRIDDRYLTSQAQYQHHGQQRDAAYQDHPAKGDKAVGGVAAKLDYDMEQMTDFVTEMSVGMYEIYKSRICIADIDLTRSIKPGVTAPPTFRKWVLAVLNSTRLPSATILLSLSYLTLRIRGLSAKGQIAPTEQHFSQLLTVALILGSKFLDDNTFQNKSWAEVSNIPVASLNKDEREWLGAFNHRLHHDSKSPDGYECWEEQWKAYKVRSASASVALRAVDDSSVRRQPSLRHSLTTSHYQQHRPAMVNTSRGSNMVDIQYSTPSYSPYGPWYNPRSASESSPSTAPHTGPNTPDYYGTHGGWGPLDVYSARQQHFGFPALPQFPSDMTPYNAPYPTSNFNHLGNGMWNCHGAACQCSQCRQAHFFQPRYGPIVVG